VLPLKPLQYAASGAEVGQRNLAPSVNITLQPQLEPDAKERPCPEQGLRQWFGPEAVLTELPEVEPQLAPAFLCDPGASDLSLIRLLEADGASEVDLGRMFRGNGQPPLRAALTS
jgi:hypothetical protein